MAGWQAKQARAKNIFVQHNIQFREANLFLLSLQVGMDLNLIGIAKISGGIYEMRRQLEYGLLTGFDDNFG